MNIYRDWGWAEEYVKAMYLMLQQDQEELALEIGQVLTNISEMENCTLLVNLNDVDREEVGLFFSEIAMHEFNVN